MDLKKLIFRSEKLTSLPEVQTWEVRWTSRHGKYSSDTREEVRAFVCREDAKTFARALRDAFALLKHTDQTEVTVSKVD